jgi:hypothetical protein
MYANELIGDFWDALNQLIDRKQERIWTAMPMVVNTWNYPGNGQNTVHATPGIQAQQLQADGTYMSVPMPEIPDMPVHFMGGGGFFMTHPITQGDEGIGIFAGRCIDGWWQNGGVQPRPDYGTTRQHSLSDGMFIPTRLSNKNILTGISKTSAQLRSIDGKSYIEMLPNGGGFNFVTAGGTTKIDGSGNFTTTGEVTRGQATGDQVSLGRHTHGGVTSGINNTIKPNAGT